jgi:hypothetical protein
MRGPSSNSPRSAGSTRNCDPTGKSEQHGGGIREFATPAGQKPAARKKQFRQRIHPDLPCPALSRKINLFRFYRNQGFFIHPASIRGALRAIVTTREAGMRWT